MEISEGTAEQAIKLIHKEHGVKEELVTREQGCHARSPATLCLLSELTCRVAM